MNILIKQILFNSQDHHLEIQLRSKILREPLGLKFSAEELAGEKNQIHIGAFLDSTLLGCLLLVPLQDKTIKMRQVAVDSHCHGKGIGKQLVAFSENMARQMGFEKMILNARQTAIPFYLSLGYEVHGDEFEEVTLPHRKMTKSLAVGLFGHN